MQLKDQVALVTGGGSGLGRAIVERYVEEGAHVAIFDRSHERIEEVTRALGGKVIGIAGDVREMADNKRAVVECVKAFGKLDTLVGNAGVWDWSKSLVSTADDALVSAFDEMFAINVKGYVLAAKAALPELYKSKGQMIFTASNASFYPGGGGVLYTATKHAVVGMIKQMAHEFAPHVRVNGVAPGGIGGSNLAGIGALGQAGQKFSELPLNDLMKQMLPLERAFHAREYAGAYVFFANRKDNQPGTGGVLNFDGGIGMRGFASANMGAELVEAFGNA
ncbi:3-(cis-5,6-dihydroxycyclohexa-1,3-dien-1-yl)propanoate dehydrogenase [Allorhizobium sp. NPDC080224]|uniref:3-phenylpropionate-dihydrodiol/cinnamic acid-dihydrodiol dehydrogenase n=2 Tax=Alphaproteobacteria TaxID=28211 RepID=F8WTY7_9HYPH|nr:MULTISPECIES: 3-(cis-5,6-dihydroxycyclohexa-1,3-dien-1-yl)propanoate dehydrogenase [Alphaproteobacteria]NTE55357.1 3-(cis-5,6-dihydroxycyclohexa-1,3-dien-1-yl)propanoate dehydrogenase [Agrobacterium tumefaciens]NTE72739.1 3-(cis-5,6-dihydroxycyclohexa-1,3-dien-1-yl)propanoate dehydrogenase [Agrobacterium tumefaciens]BAK61716.1 putative dihydrodiol dehydrogenase [Ciceribacter naphthalenivorans]GEO85998.1 3-phenylpropionate-dihydrodiol/cinnamic acid-dihydrodiol dehydrogenase [Ciceribacter naph